MYKESICILGLGYIGLPTACILANLGYFVSGMDINAKIISNLQSSTYFTSEPGLQELLEKVITNNSIQFTTNVISSDIYIIAVPTPINHDYQPDITHIESAIDSIIPFIKPGNLVIIESTCPIGTTEKIAKKLRGVCNETYIAYCSERVLPGNIIYELIHNNRVVGGIDPTSTTKAINFYKNFVSGKLSSTNAKTAEAVKIAENTYRDINIAYANELSIIADQLHINVEKLISLANEHSRVNILLPSIGVGGHCIAIDPYFLIASAPNHTKLIKAARQVNNQKTEWVIQKIQQKAQQANLKTITCLGLTYKPNVSDTRNSPAIKIIDVLQKQFNVIAIDPYINSVISLEEAMANSEMIVKLVAHSQFDNIPEKLLKHIIYIDFTGNHL